MTTVAAYVDAAVAVLQRDVAVYRTYRLRLPASILGSLVTVAIFYYVSRLVTGAPFGSPDAYFSFAVVGLVIMEFMFVTLTALPSRVRQELLAGTFERSVVSPFGAAAAVISMAVFPLLLALVTGLATLVVAALVFSLDFRWATVPLSVPIALVGCVSFVAVAILATAAVIVLKEAQTGIGFLATAISFLGGFVFPVALLPAWIRWTSQVQPFTPTVDLLRNVLVGTPVDGSVAAALVKILVASALLLPLSLWVLRAAIRKAQKRGTIIEY